MERKPKKPKAKATNPDQPVRISKRGIANDGRPVEWTEERAMKLAEDLKVWMMEDEQENIFFQEYLTKNSIRTATIADLSSKYADFSKAIKELKTLQEFRINKLALKQKVNPVMAIFLLKNLHGYADKQEVKTENVNYNYDPSDLRAKTTDELLELLNQETNTTR